jgi:hypothetical protein
MDTKKKKKPKAKPVSIRDVEARLQDVEAQLAALVRLLDPVARTERMLSAQGR